MESDAAKQLRKRRTLVDWLRIVRGDGLTPDESDLASYTPLCLDCGYDLTGLVDGTCPECGHYFSHERLLASFRFRMRERRRRLAWLGNVPVVLAFAPLFTTCVSDSYVGFTVNACLIVLGALLWYVLAPARFIEMAYVLLVLLIPIAVLFFSICTHERGLVGMLICLVMATLVSILALRGSPLVSTLILGGVVLIPGLVVGIGLLVQGESVLRAGHWWTDFDYPAFPRWRAVPAPMAVQGGWTMLGLVALVGVAMGAYARRSLVRLKRRKRMANGRAVGDRASSVSENPRGVPGRFAEPSRDPGEQEG